VARGTYSIGQLAELSGLPVKTIRFYSDLGLLPPAGRTEAGHRRYDATDLARLQLVRSLRDLDVALPTIARVLEGRDSLGEILAAHIHTLETRIEALRRQLAVLKAAARSPTESTVRRLQALTRLQAVERQRLLERFWDSVLEGVPIDASLAERFRAYGTPELPDEPTPEQLDAWLELAVLASDEDFVRSTGSPARGSGSTPSSRSTRRPGGRRCGPLASGRRRSWRPVRHPATRRPMR
jgi:DNA-binding transcriptional MerR regulator